MAADFDRLAFVIKHERLGGADVAGNVPIENHHAMDSGCHSRQLKAKVGIVRQNPGHILSNLFDAVQLAPLAKPSLRNQRGLVKHIVCIVGHDAVYIVAVPGFDPMVGKLPSLGIRNQRFVIKDLHL